MNLRASLAGLPILEKYDLLEEIGHGGMATVYRAKDKRLGREVAVKIIHKHLRENSEVATRFTAEARAAAKLRHPNLVEVYDVSNDDDRYRYLVVELIRGTTLRKVLQEHREMPAEIGAAIVLELCEALTHAHEAGIVHRDVKPENVLIELPPGCKGSPRDAEGSPVEATHVPGPRESGIESARPSDRISEPGRSSRKSSRGRDLVVIKLTDFGIAKMLDAQGVTATGQVLGSPAHMAPEQIEGGDVDARTDVFALGVLMYEALVGHLPFEGKNPAQVLRKVLDGKYAPPEAERASIGARWARILSQALARETDQRTPSPAALGEQIRAELNILGITDPPAELTAYFRDPRAYASALVERLVPGLLARGEAARKVGDSPSAAADFNRALALRPQDLGILKRITNLSASRTRRAFARKAGIILAISLTLGFSSFGVVRYFRQRTITAETAPAASTLETAAPAPDETFDPDMDPPPELSPSAEASARPTARPITSAPVVMSAATAQPSGTSMAGKSGTRKVRFTIVPAGGTFYLDGSQRDWLSSVFELPIGPHSVRVAVPAADCCDELNAAVTVTRPPPDTPDAIENFTLRAPLRPAMVRLTGAPANAQLLCTQIGLSLFAGQSAPIKLPDLQWSGSCEFRPPQADAAAKKRSVTLRAGRSNDVPWPG
jgi:eukaryotic-like serine/threonine-protein kinase